MTATFREQKQSRHQIWRGRLYFLIFNSKNEKYSIVFTIIIGEPAGIFHITTGSPKGSNDDYSFRVVGFFCSYVFDAAFPVVAQVVETQAVYFFVYQFFQSVF